MGTKTVNVPFLIPQRLLKVPFLIIQHMLKVPLFAMDPKDSVVKGNCTH